MKNKNMEKNIIIPRPAELEKTKKSIAAGGAKKIHILSDFDRTLTTAYVNGKLVSSLIFLLDKNYLTPEYHRQYKELYDKYFPIEINTKISLEEKKEKMTEWWRAVFDLLIKSRLNKKDLEKLVQSQNVKFRDGFDQFTDFLRDNNVPLIIMSATGLGGDTISMYLEKAGKLSQNIYIVANSFIWDKDGYAIAVKEPIIHVANKEEITVRNLPVFSIIKERRNVLLMGDTVEDIGMIEGFDYENLIKIGFLNEKVAENLEAYKNCYDVVILNDAGLEYVNQLLKEIIK